MKIKTSNGVKTVNEVFPDLETFKNHVLKLDKNIRYDNETIKKEMESLMIKLKKQEGFVSLSLMRGWLVKNYSFKTKKYGNIEYFIERGWSEENALEEINKRKKELKQRNRLCEEYWVNKGYSREEAMGEISKQQKKSSKYVKTYHGKSKKMLKEKGYSDEEVKRICLTPANVGFWVNKGYSECEAKTMVSKNQSNAAQHVDYEKRLLPSNIEYWVERGFTYEESKNRVSDHQTTFSKEKCIEKYGEEEGLKRFTKRQNKWFKSLTDNGNMKMGYSKVSQELFYGLIKKYDIDERGDIYFATHNGEFKLNKNGGGIWMYDFTDVNNNKIIEYNGDDYHGNPKKYLAEDYPHPFRKDVTAKEMWDKDAEKIRIANNNGFEVLTIWDSEYRWGNKKEILDKCLEFLGKK
jgi:hypothetical protein